MISAPTVGDWTGDRLAHEAFVFDDDELVRSRVVPFVQEGLERGEPLVVVAGDSVRAVLAAEFGSVVDEFAMFASSQAHWLGGAETLASYQEGMAPLIESGKPWRLVGEPTWLSQPGGDVWSRYEAVANDAFADYPYYSLCLHDRRRLGPALVESALRTHPLTWEDGRVVPSPHYQPTDAFLRSVEPAWTRAPEERETVTVTRADDARHFVRARLPEGAAEDWVDSVVLAVHELVVNAIVAAGAAEVSQWHDGGPQDGGPRDRRLHNGGLQVWEVRDDGLGMHETAAGYAPPRAEEPSGRGLWIARSLADEATVRPYGPGTAVRLYFHAAPGRV
jgi:anti-sigma regulatory factor (Ser/Thr protein kinase)